jgi:hypothetical protein
MQQHILVLDRVKERLFVAQRDRHDGPQRFVFELRQVEP